MADAKQVKARVLVDSVFGKCNTVVTVGEDDVKSNPGQLDAHPSSVKAGEESDEHKAMLAAAASAKKK